MPAPFSRRQLLRRSAAAFALWGVPQCLIQGTGRICFAADEPFDLLLTGGTVVDGTGLARKTADVAVRGDRIARIGDLTDAPAARRIDAAGFIIAPGFIDMHAHSDRTLLLDGLAQSAVRQGATTHVIGNCGSSPAPMAEGRAEKGKTFALYGEFLAALKTSGLSLNVCGLVGHNAVRAAAMGFADRRPTDSEMQRMKDLVDEAMRAGAVGMSTGLVTPPGTYSRTDEIVELARVVARHGGMYASHIRGEASQLIDSVREAIEIARQARLPVEVSHLKAAGEENWGHTRHALAMIEEANRAGLTVRADVYPYRAGSAGMTQLVPPWAHEGGPSALLARLADPAVRPRIAREMVQGNPDWPNFFHFSWDDIQIASVSSAENRPWVGKTIGDLARARGCAGVDACIDLLIEERASVQMINFIMDEDEMRRVLVHELTMIGSDGTAVSPEIEKGQPHPRYYGCFPRVLGRYVRELGLLSLEAAIRKTSAMQAAQLGLDRRGLVREGYAADLVVFDEARVIDRATFENPQQYPVGVETVIVNGQVVVDRGKHTGAKPGRILSPQRA